MSLWVFVWFVIGYTVCMNNEYIKLPRLFIDYGIESGKTLPLNAGQAHYLKNVLRKSQNEEIRVFNGHDGEWLCAVETLKKQGGTCVAIEQIHEQPPEKGGVHLIFTPLKKHRMDIIIEKAVELGVTDYHPVLTNRTEVRKINQERIEAQIIEAAEQSERLSIPKLHDLRKLDTVVARWPTDIHLYACLERGDVQPLDQALKKGPAAFIIGPVGGFDEEEHAWLKQHESIIPVSLGDTILRCETAALACLSLYHLKTSK